MFVRHEKGRVRVPVEVASRPPINVSGDIHGYLRHAEGLRREGRQLARELGISRPLLHLHLQKLEQAGLVTSKLELSSDGKALNYFEVAKLDFVLTPAAVTAAANSLTSSK